MGFIRYARVPTREENPDGQTDALAVAGCIRVFVERASAVRAKLPALDDKLDYLPSGGSLVVTKLDRLGRSVRNLKEFVEGLLLRGVGLKALSQGIDTTTHCSRLFSHMLAAIAEFEHDLIVERIHDGLAAVRARGRTGGGRFMIIPTKAKPARTVCDTKSYTLQQIAETIGVSRGTIYRHLGDSVSRH
jgi:DNA invertase Pin-like site-specific DNA recombinase